MVGEVFVATGLVVTVKVAVVVFAGTVTFAGTLAAPGLLLNKLTTAPLAGAGPVKITVPVDEVPPITEVGFSVTELDEGGVTVKFAVLVPL